MSPQRGRAERSFDGTPHERLEVWVGAPAGAVDAREAGQGGPGSLTGWTSIELVRTLTSAAGRFRVEGPRSTFEGVEVGMEADVVLIAPDGSETPLLVGSVEELEDPLLGGSMSIAGRDRTGDLVDSTVRDQPGTWVDSTVARILQDLADPHRVRVDFVTPDVDAPVPGAFSVTPGETVWSAMERLVRRRGALAFAGPEGNLIVGRPGAGGDSGGELREGGNLLSASRRQSDTDRFRTYIVRGQGPGSDAAFGAAVLHVEARASDAGILRDRALTIVAEGSLDPETAKLRAEWEAAFRAARGDSVAASVAGFRESSRNGLSDPRAAPWRVNTLVPLTAGPIDRALLAETVTMRRSTRGGSRTELLLVHPDAYQPKPAVDAGVEVP